MRALTIAVLGCVGLLLSACGSNWNDPYPVTDAGQNVLYTEFTERPKHLDPAISFASNEAEITYQVYEMPVQYHYLKRPYELIPQLAEELPQAAFFDKSDQPLPATADPKTVAYSLYTVKVKRGVKFQPHQAFVERNRALPPEQIKALAKLSDVPATDTRELKADDFIYQIKRLAHPRLNSPILSHMADYIDGLGDYAKTLKTADDALIKVQGKGAWLDLRKHAFSGVKQLDAYTYQIRVKGVYPQFGFWLAMPFFTAVPWEADQFFSQPGMQERNLTLDWYPVGTGPYMLVENDPNARMTLQRNPNFRGETYPSEGEASDRAAGLLRDAGQTIPFIDRVIFTREKESVPTWNKFLQGYYDFAGIASDNFDQAIKVDLSGGAALSPEMEKRGVQLRTASTGLTYYMGINMQDPLIGGNSSDAAANDRARKIRQAISIAMDWEEYVGIFLNGRGDAAQSPIPPGIFGSETGEAGINSVTHEWRDGKVMRRPIEAAKKLLADAGYPSGRDAKTGTPLVLYLDSTGGGPSAKANLDWYRKQLAKIDIQLEIRSSDWNRFQEKVRKGNTQLFFLGWDADYPDPENFLFLLYGPNGAVKSEGENKVNYSSPEFDRLFEQVKTMPNSPERLAMIRSMVNIVRADAPWVFAFNPKKFGLYHTWLDNVKPNHFARGNLKYRKLDPAKRDTSRASWNQPVVWPFVLILLALLTLTWPAVRMWRAREAATVALSNPPAVRSA